jgi:hypothetical protein
VPNNQEVYLADAGFTSIIFDLLERVENVPGQAGVVSNGGGSVVNGVHSNGDDHAAVVYHLKELLDDDSAANVPGAIQTGPVTNEVAHKLP